MLPTQREQMWLLLGVATGVTLALLFRRSSTRRTANGTSLLGQDKPLLVTRRVQACIPLPIKEIAAEVASKIAAGHSIVNMSQGVPCLPIFEKSDKAMTAIVQSRRLPYSAVPGIESVRKTCAAFVNSMYGLADAFSAENVIVTAGGIQACHLAFGLVLEGPDDVVVSTVPAYPLYQLESAYFGATFAPIALSRDGGAVPSPEGLEAAFAQHRAAGRQLRALVLCAPNNPTGAAMTEEEARGLATVLEAEMRREQAAVALGDQRPKGFIVLLDEVYIGIEGSAHVSLLQFASPALRRRLCLVLSASKGLGAMPGARAAWVTCADPALVLDMAKIQSCASGNASTIAQAGLQASLEHCLSSPSVLREVSEYYAVRTRRVADGLNALGRKHKLSQPLCRAPDATFYVWADFAQLRAVPSDKVIFERLLELGVALIPGSAFSVAPERKLVRLSCAQDSLAMIDTALEIIDRAMGEWLWL